jgi:hypothetical protein
VATHALVVLKSVRGKGVLRINPKKAISPFNGEIVIPKRQLVKKDMAVWAKGKNKLRGSVGRMC